MRLLHFDFFADFLVRRRLELVLQISVMVLHLLLLIHVLALVGAQVAVQVVRLGRGDAHAGPLRDTMTGCEGVAGFQR